MTKEDDKGEWCLLVHNIHKKEITDKLTNLKLICDNHNKYLLSIIHNINKIGVIPIKYQFATNIMNVVGCINDNKLRYWYDLYENILSTHSNKYSFDIDLLIECINIIILFSIQYFEG